jgi:hypothetical protein
MRRNAFVTLVVVAVVLGGVIGGAFAGGMAIGKDQGRDEGREEAEENFQSQLSQSMSRLGQGGIQQDSLFPGAFGGVMGGRGTMGVVENVGGNVVTLNTREGTVRILTSAGTSIQKMDEGNLDDILRGESISVSGERQEDGSIEATSIFVTPGLMSLPRMQHLP